MMGDASSQRGMTLVEVLVALAILGFVAAAVLSLISQNTRFVAAAEERMIASMLADNLMVEALATATRLEQGVSDGQTEFGGRSWTYSQTVTEIGVTRLVRVDIIVRDSAGRQSLASATTLKREG